MNNKHSNYIGDKFESYISSIYTPRPPDHQMKELEAAFRAGAAVVTKRIHESVSGGKEESVPDILNDCGMELREYKNKLLLNILTKDLESHLSGEQEKASGDKEDKAMNRTEELLGKAKRVHTTSRANGYPANEMVAYTADTMGELRELEETAKKEGYEVTPVLLHARNGWGLWHRMSMGYITLDDDAYMGVTETETYIDLKPGDDREEAAFDFLYTAEPFENLAELKELVKRVEELANELPDPDGLEEGQMHRVWLGSDLLPDYTVTTGQNGYHFDTHHYQTALIIEEREEEND